METQKASQASEYLKLSRKLLTVPSGAIFEIRKMPRSIFFQVSSYIDAIKDMKIDNIAAISDEQQKAFTQMYNTVLTSCITNPKVVMDVINTEQLSIDDIGFEDQAALINGVFALSGMTAKDDEERKNSSPPT
jgi:hypothetical protein